MKSKELNSLRNKDTQELKKLLDKKIMEAFQVKVNIKVSKDKNLKHVKMLKRDISQIATILRESELLKKDKLEKEESEG